MSTRAAMESTVNGWAETGHPPRPVDREVLLVMADAIDAAGDAPRDAVAIINACRYVMAAVRAVAPPDALPDDGYDAAMVDEWPTETD